ncbi:protoporphyrinogen oxidase [Vibrio navarrensis]|uniref:Protoporphyrinogen IX dehydrogenase [quinone] n=1 Tax=Vibrio navarrensis TaxID=29495 RepID=A0AAJ4IBG8_9VIBR|nr:MULTISPECIES: menaquinone-dependent protoporphyrinogen IX dehydrogenase [Vibrio]KJR39534.1 protoporphyrinogen oxidase [Vibrio sp. S234-5]MBE3653978.1 protoporphyrinogen oxidase [Vibrio navarrensis]MBE3657595.1 protoporphyrinogen oxidase [Vibrio navarrensis]MBE3662136.1 protoporphyrinogen oxidase [Vibrio navarrensis]MBE4605435.1 protoporphyrinogen oxidase [Vibrio navarrensis]
MKKALFLYSSREGQTKKILLYIEKQLQGYQCDVVNLHEADEIRFAEYDKVLIGASIRYGHLNKKLYQFIERHIDLLQQCKAAFFCVNLTARKEEQGKDTPEGSVYIKTFLSKSAWQPTLIGVFAGALYYPRYNWFDRNMIKLIMTLTGGETDTSKEVEYTNWQKVGVFADKFAQL